MVLKKSFRAALAHKKIIAFYYAGLCILVLLVALVMGYVLQNSLGASTILNDFLESKDSNLLNDIIRQNPKAIGVCCAVLLAVMVLFSLLASFLTGGIINTLKKNVFKKEEFLFFSKAYFWKYFRLYLLIGTYIFVALLVMLLLFLFLVISDITLSDKSQYYMLAIPAFLFIAGLVFLFVLADYAKYLIYEYPYFGVRAHLIKSYKLLMKHKKFIAFHLLIFGLVALLGMVLKALPLPIALLLVLQQAYIVFRVFSKIWALKTAESLIYKT